MQELNTSQIILIYFLTVIHYIITIVQKSLLFVNRYKIPIFIFIFIVLFFIKKTNIKNLKPSDIVVIFPLIVLLIISCCNLCCSLFIRNYGYILKKESVDLMTKKFIDDGNLPPDLTPDIYGLRDPLIKIFSVPKKYSVGTNDINNAISNLTFQDENVIYTVQKKDFLDYVSGGAQYHISINDEYIGYSQERRFILFNYKKKSFQKYVITTDGDEYIKKVMVLDWEKRLFVFEVWQAWEHTHKKFIRIFYLQDEEQRFIKEDIFGSYQTLSGEYKWQVYNKSIFFHHDNVVEVYNENLNKITHPLAEFINESSDKFNCLRRFLIHPYLPFALIVDDLEPLDSNVAHNKKMWVVRWEHPDEDDKLIPFFPYIKSIIKPVLKTFIVIEIQLSPDGRWLVIHDQSDWRNSDSFVAIPVEPDNPKYFGTPKLLGKSFFNSNETSTAWIADPLCFVACYGGSLYKWELDRLLNSSDSDEGEIDENNE